MQEVLLKNLKIAKSIGVSHPTIGRWIVEASEKKNNLQIQETKGRYYILDNEHNWSELNKLKNLGSKFRNKIGYERVEVSEELYKYFERNNLIELITKLEDDRIIPLKYTYLGKGADYWNESVNSMIGERNYYLNDNQQLISKSLENLLAQAKGSETVNIVDVGVGNGYTVKPIIDFLLLNGFNVTYKGIDISQKMLDLNNLNLKKWYPELKLSHEIGDIDYMVIRSILFNNKITNPSSCNLILFIGWTLGNVYDRNRVLTNFSDSMSGGDFLVLDNGLDLKSLRTRFNFLSQDPINQRLSWIPKLLGLRDDMYEKIHRYDSVSKRIIQSLKLNKEIDIVFNLPQGKKVLHFNESDEIIIWNLYRQKLRELIDDLYRVDLEPSYLSRNQDHSQVLVLCEKTSKP